MSSRGRGKATAKTRTTRFKADTLSSPIRHSTTSASPSTRMSHSRSEGVKPRRKSVAVGLASVEKRANPALRVKSMAKSKSTTSKTGLMQRLTIAESSSDDIVAKQREKKQEEEDKAAVLDFVSICELYEVKQVLGRGAFGVVRLLIDKKTGKKYALKSMEKYDGDPEDPEQKSRLSRLRGECQLMARLSHPNIVKLITSMESNSKLYLVLELLSGGEVMEKLSKMGTYTESNARDVIKSVLDAVIYLHDKDIIHRDLKPENIMLSDDTDDAIAKVADFGLSAKTKKFVAGITGTPLYLAPEIVREIGAEKGSDMWSIGCIAYQLLCGNPPFRPDPHDTTFSTLFSRIVEGYLDFTESTWTSVSDSAKSFIRKLLLVNPAHRYTAKEAMQHPWMTGEGESGALPVTVQDMMKSFLAAQRFRKGGLGVLGMIGFWKGVQIGVDSSYHQLDNDYVGKKRPCLLIKHQRPQGRRL